MSVLRPLPPRPSLEFEHKQAKSLLRRLRAGDPDALARARERHPAIDAADPARIRLADAQLVLAREYGFASWPRLVRWFGDVERQRHALRPLQFGPAVFERLLRSWRIELSERRTFVGRALAAYVPRFLGMRVDQVLDATVTDDELRLAMARQYCCPSWDVLIERAAADATRDLSSEWEVSPRERAFRAIVAADLDALRRAVEADRGLLVGSDQDVAMGSSLLVAALRQERKQGAERVRPIVDWLVAQGLDLQRTLNVRLCGHRNIRPDTVRWLLDRAADPDWVAPNGIPVLEHALLRYANGAAVDELAARAKPRAALWIAAGLGDVDGVRRSLDRAGRPTATARRLRPDFDAVGAFGGLPALPDPDDEELLLEAFLVAMLNGRVSVMEYMASRGTPVDSTIYGMPLLNMAVGNGDATLVECLLRCGASLDVRGWRPATTAREAAREHLEMFPDDPARRRIAALCGLDADAILDEREARPVEPPQPEPALDTALALARDDAARRGLAEVDRESLLVGVLGAGGLALQLFTRWSGMDVERFLVEMSPRLRPAAARVDRDDREDPPLGAEARAALAAALDAAARRRRDVLMAVHLLHELARDADGPAAVLLARYGGDPARLDEALAKSA